MKTVNNIIVRQPTRSSGIPDVEYWLESQNNKIHFMAQNPGGTPRKIFTVYEDGRGYRNKHSQILVEGIQFDDNGRIIVKDYGTETHHESCRCNCCQH